MTLFTKATLLFLTVVACLTFQLNAADDPVELTSSDDTWLSSDYTGKAQKRGEADEMQIYGKADDTGNRAIIKFDLKKAAPGFKAAILRVTSWNFSFTETRTSYFRCHPLLNAWNEETATWDIRNGKMTWTHPGGDFDPKPASGFMFTGPMGAGGDRELFFDVTNVAREWQAQPGKNEGVAIMLEKGCAAEVRVRTHEFATATSRPKLLLYYQKAPEKKFAVIPGDQLPPYEPYDPAAPSVSVKHAELKLNDAFETKYSASGAKEPYTFVLASAPIPGMNLTPDGAMKGKPSKAGAYIVGVTCVASNNKKSTQWDRWIVIDPNAKAPVVAENKPKDPAKPADDKKPDPAAPAKPKPAGGPQEE